MKLSTLTHNHITNVNMSSTCLTFVKINNGINLMLTPGCPSFGRALRFLRLLQTVNWLDRKLIRFNLLRTTFLMKKGHILLKKLNACSLQVSYKIKNTKRARKFKFYNRRRNHTKWILCGKIRRYIALHLFSNRILRQLNFQNRFTAMHYHKLEKISAMRCILWEKI